MEWFGHQGRQKLSQKPKFSGDLSCS
jgi:hypothetical protein